MATFFTKLWRRNHRATPATHREAGSTESSLPPALRNLTWELHQNLPEPGAYLGWRPHRSAMLGKRQKNIHKNTKLHHRYVWPCRKSTTYLLRGVGGIFDPLWREATKLFNIFVQSRWNLIPYEDWIPLGPSKQRPCSTYGCLSRISGLVESSRPQSWVAGAGCHEGCTVSGRKTVARQSLAVDPAACFEPSFSCWTCVFGGCRSCLI